MTFALPNVYWKMDEKYCSRRESWAHGWSLYFIWNDPKGSQDSEFRYVIGEYSPIVNQMLQFLCLLELSLRAKLNLLYERACKTMHKAGVKVLVTFSGLHWFVESRVAGTFWVQQTIFTDFNLFVTPQYVPATLPSLLSLPAILLSADAAAAFLLSVRPHSLLIQTWAYNKVEWYSKLTFFSPTRLLMYACER